MLLARDLTSDNMVGGRGVALLRPRPRDVVMARSGIRIENLSRKFGARWVLKSIDLTLDEGRIFALVGANGAGKSTMINILTGLLAATAGRAEVAGFDVARSPQEAKGVIGLVPDRLYLFERLTGEEHIRFSGRLYGLSAAEATERTAALLDALGLLGDAKKLVQHYSHGMRKKVALACAIIHAPKVLLLDEPFEGLDSTLAALVQRLLRRMARAGTTILVTSHILPIVVELCDEIVVLHEGQIVTSGSPTAVCGGSSGSLEELIRSVNGARPDSGRLAWLG